MFFHFVLSFFYLIYFFYLVNHHTYSRVLQFVLLLYYWHHHHWVFHPYPHSHLPCCCCCCCCCCCRCRCRCRCRRRRRRRRCCRRCCCCCRCWLTTTTHPPRSHMDDLHCLDAVEWCKQPPPPACAINPPARPVNNSRHLLVVDDCHAIPLRYFDLEGTRGSIVGPFPDKRRQADDHRPAPEIALPSGALQAAIRTVSGCGGGRATRPCHRHVVRRCGVCPSGALC